MPESDTVELPISGSFETTVALAPRTPAAVGLKLTVTVVLAPTATVWGKVDEVE